jgi:hypothetical protein
MTWYSHLQQQFGKRQTFTQISWKAINTVLENVLFEKGQLRWDAETRCFEANKKAAQAIVDNSKAVQIVQEIEHELNAIEDSLDAHPSDIEAAYQMKVSLTAIKAIISGDESARDLRAPAAPIDQPAETSDETDHNQSIEAQLSKASEEKKKLETQLREVETNLALSEREGRYAQRTIINLHTKMEDRDRQLAEKDEELEEQDNKLKEKDNKLKEKDQKLREMNSEVGMLQIDLDASKSTVRHFPQWLQNLLGVKRSHITMYALEYMGNMEWDVERKGKSLKERFKKKRGKVGKKSDETAKGEKKANDNSPPEEKVSNQRSSPKPQPGPYASLPELTTDPLESAIDSAIDHLDSAKADLDLNPKPLPEALGSAKVTDLGPITKQLPEPIAEDISRRAATPFSSSIRIFECITAKLPTATSGFLLALRSSRTARSPSTRSPDPTPKTHIIEVCFWLAGEDG